MRILALSTLAATACGGSSAPPPPAAYRFLPANPELAVRLDLVRARAWPHYAKAAEIATRDAHDLLEAAKTRCDLDVMGEATTLVLARGGTLLGGDLALIVSGLPRAKVTSCLTTIASAGSVVTPVLDGDLVHLEVGGKSLASGAFLPAGELVLVSRAGAGVAPAAWKAEVTGRTGTAPAWTRDLHPAKPAPLVVRSVSAERTVLASVQLADPLEIRGTLIAPTAEAATADAARARAILTYLEQGDAGTGRVAPSGTTVQAELTAKGAQIENLVAIALPALLGETASAPPRDLAADATATPGDCTTLAPAVAAYINEGLNRAPPDNRAAMASSMTVLIPKLQQAFVDNCTADRWSGATIACHVTHATDLPRFEKCSQALPADQRARLEQALTTALAPAPR